MAGGLDKEGVLRKEVDEIPEEFWEAWIKGMYDKKVLAEVAEQVDAPDLKSGAERHAGSSPAFGIVSETNHTEEVERIKKDYSFLRTTPQKMKRVIMQREFGRRIGNFGILFDGYGGTINTPREMWLFENGQSLLSLQGLRRAGLR